MSKTNIPWATHVWNPLVGCTKVSAGCKNCWAERMAFRLKHMGRPEYQEVVDDEGHWTGKIYSVQSRWEEPRHWRKPRRVFVCSMSDLFHPKAFSIWSVAMAMYQASQHTFLILTKRPGRMQRFVRDFIDNGPGYWPDHIWLGISCENQATADERIPVLLNIPAAVRWVSLEPMLGPINLRPYPDFSDGGYRRAWLGKDCGDAGHSRGLDWVIVGSESGPNRRLFEKEWAWDVLDQCREAGVACFLKQDSGIRPGVPLLDREGKTVKEWPTSGS